MDHRRVVFLVCLMGFVAFINGQDSEKTPQLTDSCLSCICEACSECDEDIECHGFGPLQKNCGPYLISYPYWKDGGALGDDFDKCVTYKPCAEETIRAYMKRWGSDCDGDHDVDCYDFARIHKTGPAPSCNSTWVLNTDFWMRFDACYSQMV